MITRREHDIKHLELCIEDLRIKKAFIVLEMEQLEKELVILNEKSSLE